MDDKPPIHKFNIPELPIPKGEITLPVYGTGEELKEQTRQLQMEHQLREMIANDKDNAKLPPLPNLSLKKYIGKNWDKYRAYGVARPMTDIVDVVSYRPFHAVYPQTFTPIANHYLDRGISPPYVVHQDEDYNFGVITIASMIELVQNDIPWRICDINDLPIILRICHKYKTLLEPYALDKIPTNDAKDYYYKVDKFINFINDRYHNYTHLRDRDNVDTGAGIAELYKSFGVI